jgi:hypothetical protein
MCKRKWRLLVSDGEGLLWVWWFSSRSKLHISECLTQGLGVGKAPGNIIRAPASNKLDLRHGMWVITRGFCMSLFYRNHIKHSYLKFTCAKSTLLSPDEGKVLGRKVRKSSSLPLGPFQDRWIGRECLI